MRNGAGFIVCLPRCSEAATATTSQQPRSQSLPAPSPMSLVTRSQTHLVLKS